jgi:hypothetical protein
VPYRNPRLAQIRIERVDSSRQKKLTGAHLAMGLIHGQIEALERCRNAPNPLDNCLSFLHV